MRRRRHLGLARYEPYVPLLARLASPAGEPIPRAVSDPALLVEAARFHGVTGQVLAALRQGRLRLPSEQFAGLEAAHLRCIVTAALLRAELARAGPVISAACGTEAVLLKGPGVADLYYSDPELRLFEDLDFVLPRDRVPAAAAALREACEYRIAPAPWPSSVPRHGHALAMGRQLGVHVLGVELHWRISDDPRAAALDHARLSEAAHSFETAPELLVPGCTELLVALALHLVHHGHRRLIWLLDVAAVGTAASDEEWRAAFDLADELGLGWVLDVALDLTDRHLPFSRPRPRRASRPEAWGPLRTANAIGGPVGYHLGHLATLRWPERASYLAAGARGRARRLMGRA